MWPEPTELLLIGCLTESTYNLARGKRPKQPGWIKVWTSLVSQHAAENSVRRTPTMARQCNFQQRQQSDAQISHTRKKCEETNRQVSPQLVTVCEGGRSIPSKCGSLKSPMCTSPFHGTLRKSWRISRKRWMLQKMHHLLGSTHKANILIWRMFVSALMIHMEPDYFLIWTFQEH